MPGIRFGFSWVGAAFLAMLMVPNLIWARHKPQGYEAYAAQENRLLLALERLGQAAVTCLLLISANLDPDPGAAPGRVGWLAAAFGLMLLYEAHWVRYFRSEKTMRDYYRSLLGIPLAGATLPVAAAGLLSIFCKSPYLAAAAAILGIGHIGIHLGHRRALEQDVRKE